MVVSRRPGDREDTLIGWLPVTRKAVYFHVYIEDIVPQITYSLGIFLRIVLIVSNIWVFAVSHSVYGTALFYFIILIVLWGRVYR